MRRLSDTPKMNWSSPVYKTTPDDPKRIIEVRDHLYRVIRMSGTPAEWAYIEADERLAEMARKYPELDDTALAGKVVEDMI